MGRTFDIMDSGYGARQTAVTGTAPWASGRTSDDMRTRVCNRGGSIPPRLEGGEGGGGGGVCLSVRVWCGVGGLGGRTRL